MIQPCISVIIPVHNSAEFLDDCLKSVSNQTYDDLEIICVNDGSSDNSGAILKEYAQKDNRVKIITTDCHGVGDARNKGVVSSKGKYIFFLDSDDLLHHRALENFIAIADKTHADIVCGKFKMIRNSTADNEEKLTGQFTYLENPIQCFFSHPIQTPATVWNKLYKRDLIENIRFLPRVYYEDIPFTLQVFLRAKSCALTSDLTYLYRVSNVSIMRSAITEQKINDFFKIWHVIYKDLTQNHKITERDVVFKNYFTHLQEWVLHQYRLSPALKRYFLDHGRSLNKRYNNIQNIAKMMER